MNIKKRFLLLIILLIFIFSLITFILIVKYLDPYVYNILSVLSITFTFILGVSSFFCLFIYLFKKIYYRDNVYLYHVLSSFRQGFFISLFLFFLILFYRIGIYIYISGFFLFIILFFLELLIQNFES